MCSVYTAAITPRVCTSVLFIIRVLDAPFDLCRPNIFGQCYHYNVHAIEFHYNTHAHAMMVSIQDGPSDLPEFERLTGVSESDLLHPHWTAILSVPKHSTMQQIEASVIKLIEVHVGIYV